MENNVEIEIKMETMDTSVNEDTIDVREDSNSNKLEESNHSILPMPNLDRLIAFVNKNIRVKVDLSTSTESSFKFPDHVIPSNICPFESKYPFMCLGNIPSPRRHEDFRKHNDDDDDHHVEEPSQKSELLYTYRIHEIFDIHGPRKCQTSCTIMKDSVEKTIVTSFLDELSSFSQDPEFSKDAHSTKEKIQKIWKLGILIKF